MWRDLKSREKQRLYKLFLNFTAISIQKNWKGFRIRKLYNKKIKIRAIAKKKIRRFARIWKTKSILQTRRIKQYLKGMHETKILLEEVRNDKSSAGLFKQLLAQLVSFHNKFRVDFNTLYMTGK